MKEILEVAVFRVMFAFAVAWVLLPAPARALDAG
jgi:hypothetical protein